VSLGAPEKRRGRVAAEGRKVPNISAGNRGSLPLGAQVQVSRVPFKSDGRHPRAWKLLGVPSKVQKVQYTNSMLEPPL